MKIEDIDFDARYRVNGYDGVAFYLHKWPDIWSPTYIYFPGENGLEEEWVEEGGEWVDGIPGDQVIAIMVGDDREHLIDIDDLEKIDDDEYCSGCGQIGCKAYGE